MSRVDVVDARSGAPGPLYLAGVGVVGARYAAVVIRPDGAQRTLTGDAASPHAAAVDAILRVARMPRAVDAPCVVYARQLSALQAVERDHALTLGARRVTLAHSPRGEDAWPVLRALSALGVES